MEDYFPQSEVEGPGVHEDEEKMEVHPGGGLESDEKKEPAQGSLEEDERPEEVEQEKPTEEELKKKNKPTKVVTMMLCVPLGSKSAQEVLAGTQELFTRLRRHGYPVGRVHTDQGREFCNGSFRRWCLERGLSRTIPVALMSMPRMEERRQLSTPSSRESDDYYMELGWKCVVVELERRRREKITEKLPHFGQTVVVKKRSWELQRQGAFESTGEQVKYLTPVPEVSKGHAVLTDRGFVKVASYTIKDIKEPVKDQDELALVEVTAEVEEGKTNLDYMMNGWEFPRRRHRRSYLVWM